MWDELAIEVMEQLDIMRVSNSTTFNTNHGALLHA